MTFYIEVTAGTVYLDKTTDGYGLFGLPSSLRIGWRGARGNSDEMANFRLEAEKMFNKIDNLFCIRCRRIGWNPSYKRQTEAAIL